MTDKALDAEIAAKAVAPRVSLADIEAMIVGEVYNTADVLILPSKNQRIVHPTNQDYVPIINTQMSLVTICVLVLRNGWTSLGTSACVSPENYDETIGRKVARQKALDGLWPVMGYALLDQQWHAKEIQKGHAAVVAARAGGVGTGS